MDGSPCGGIENTQCYIHLPGQGHRHMIAFSMCMFWNDEHHDDIIRRPEFPTFGPISYILPGTHLPWCCPHPSQSSSVWWHCGRTVRGSFPEDLSHSVETLPVLKPKQEGMANITAVGIVAAWYKYDGNPMLSKTVFFTTLSAPNANQHQATLRWHLPSQCLWCKLSKSPKMQFNEVALSTQAKNELWSHRG